MDGWATSLDSCDAPATAVTSLVDSTSGRRASVARGQGRRRRAVAPAPRPKRTQDGGAEGGSRRAEAPPLGAALRAQRTHRTAPEAPAAPGRHRRRRDAGRSSAGGIGRGKGNHKKRSVPAGGPVWDRISYRVSVARAPSPTHNVSDVKRPADNVRGRRAGGDW